MTSDHSSNKSCIRDVRRFYVHDLPYDYRKQLCYILDMNDCWKELGGRYLNLSRPELEMIGKAIMRKQSPTDELLCYMESRHRTVERLFCWLYEMEHFQAMDIIKPFVDPKFHRLIPEGTGIEPDNILPNRKIKSENTNATVIPQLNKENVKNKVEPITDRTKHVDERTTERKLSGESDVDKLDPSIPFIPFEELVIATNNWDSAQKLGRGGFGVVYKGYWRQTYIAIKRLQPPKKNEAESNMPGIQKNQSLKELKHLNISRHDNILPLYGYSIHDQKYVLVYQYMPYGSLDDRLHRTGSEYIPWSIRYKIAKGTARGLQFLHGMNPPLVHGDIKSANILLDRYFDPKIGDFGLAREGPVNQSTHVNISRVYGTRPYLPFEFIRYRKFSKKVDVYSFGVVLFEIATGKKPFDDTRSEKFLRDYVLNYDESQISLLMDPRGKQEKHLYLTLYRLFIDLGKFCVDDIPRRRPEMIDVFKILDKCENVPPTNFSYYPASSMRRNSLIPPSCTLPATSISPDGSHDPRRSPSPTNPPAYIVPNSPSPTIPSPWSNTPSPSTIHPSARSPMAISPIPVMQAVTEVSYGEKAPLPENALIHPVIDQITPPIPSIKINPPNESCARTRDISTVSGASSLISTSESEPSTRYTNTCDGVKTEDKTENEENSLSQSMLPNLSIFHNPRVESDRTSEA